MTRHELIGSVGAAAATFWSSAARAQRTPPAIKEMTAGRRLRARLARLAESCCFAGGSLAPTSEGFAIIVAALRCRQDRYGSTLTPDHRLIGSSMRAK